MGQTKTKQKQDINVSELLYQNIIDLSRISSYYKEVRQEPGYDEKRENIIKKIKQNLEDGADVHHYGSNHKDIYDNFQLAYVVDQDEIVELMIPYVRHHPPYYNTLCEPFLTHAYKYKGKGYIFKSTNDVLTPGIAENIYKEYLKVATPGEKQDLEDYKQNKNKKYEKHFAQFCNTTDNPEECVQHIQHYLNTRKLIPPEFKNKSF